MADFADIAAAREELDRGLAIAASRSGERVKPSGFCLNCGEVLVPGLLFCDADCRDDWERRSAAIRRGGGE